jgi:hypothetical protein
VIAVAIWGQFHGLVSLELASMGPPEADWEDAYRAALDAVVHAWGA